MQNEEKAVVKQHLSASAYAQAYQALEKQVGQDLVMEPLSVVSKDYIPSRGSKHDYVSIDACLVFSGIPEDR